MIVTKSRGLMAASVAFAVALTAASYGARSEGPAVSDTNAKISGFGGAVGSGGRDEGLGGIAGSLTMPLGHAFGLQLDGAYASLGGDDFGSTGAHLFWRNPAIGLLGIYGGYAHLDKFGGIDIGRIGAEGQYYMRDLTIDTAVGAKLVDVEQAYGRVRLQYYPIPDLMLQTGWVYENRSFANAGVEYQFSHSRNAGMSLFADGNINDNDNYSILAGLKVTFGQEMSLKDRHRRQDPDSYAGFDLLTTQQVGPKNEPAACPFTPLNNLCGFASLEPRYAPRIGFVPRPMSMAVSLPTPSRLQQCVGQGYTSKEPGPASCGCAATFANCN